MSSLGDKESAPSTASVNDVSLKEKVTADTLSTKSNIQLELLNYYEQNPGSLVLDPAEAATVFDESTAACLKLSEDGTKILWPQPTNDPEDPQNWSNNRKALQLFIITLAAFVPDFDSAIGIPSIFALAQQFNTTVSEINNLTSNWSIFLVGWGGLIAIPFMRRYGRLPILFWTQLLALAFLVGCTVAPDLKTYAAMRCLAGFFGGVPQVTGLYVVTDIFPFHLQARKIDVWTMGFILSPFVSPFLFGFVVARTSWRWAYAAGCLYGLIVLVLIILFLEETLYDRHLVPQPARKATGLSYRIQTLLGVTGFSMAQYRVNWRSAVGKMLEVVWRPQLVGLLVFEAMIFGFGIGINVTGTVFLGNTPVVGWGYNADQISLFYLAPMAAAIIGELAARYMNDWIMNYTVKRRRGMFDAESRLWACYPSVFLFVAGMVLLGASFEKRLGAAPLAIGWFVANVGIMTNTVAVYAFCNDCFPRHQGEISALINLARILGGFSVAFYQIPWATKSGALQTFGVEAAVVAGLFVLSVPILQIKGRYLREKFSV